MNDKLEFLSCIYNNKLDKKYLGLIQIISKNYISFYSVNDLKNEDKKIFFNLVNNWWQNEPNIPISLYYKNMFDRFNYTLHHLSTNEYEILDGFKGINLKNILEKRIKRRIINLIK